MIDCQLPETDAAVLAAHRVEGIEQVLPMLRELVRNGSAVSLSVADDTRGPFGARLAVVDDDSDTIVVELAGLAAADALMRASRVIAVAASTRLKLQFELAPCVTRIGASCLELRAPVPRELIRLQRRNAYRIRRDDEFPPRLMLARGPAVPVRVEVRVTDISVTGVGFVLPDALPAPPVGTLLAAATLELPQTEPVICGLIVRYHDRDAAGAVLRLGCQLVGLAPIAERALQVYINEVQLRPRRERVRPACS